MDYYKNSDLLNQCVNDSYRASGIQIQFINESDYIEPYSIEYFKDFARIDFNTDDNLIEILLKSARLTVEQYLQKSLGIRTIRLTALSLPKNYVLPFGSVASIVTLDFTHVGDILKEGGKDITIEYITNTYNVNEAVTTAIYKQALEYYENRTAYLDGQKELGQVINEVKILLFPYKKVQFP